jgi:hypothetical protein
MFNNNLHYRSEDFKKFSPLETLVQGITRGLTLAKKAAPLREQHILESFTPGTLVKPFKDLPNVSSMWIRPNVMDPLLDKHGLSVKLDPDIKYTVMSNKTKAANRYLRIMYYKIEKLLANGQHAEYWLYALALMSKSKVIRAVALRKLNRNWHRDYTFRDVKAMLSRLDHMIENLEDKIRITRKYVVKDPVAGTWRPIGSPALADRMYLYIWQSFFVMYVNSYINEHQHAYRPGKGVATAIEDISKLLKDKSYKYIYEFDLKGAFPSVSIETTTSALNHFGMPKNLTDYLLMMSVKTVEVVNRLTQKMPEHKFDRQDKLEAGMIYSNQADFNLNPFLAAARAHSVKDANWSPERPAWNLSIKDYESRIAEIDALALEDKWVPANWGFEKSVRKMMGATLHMPVSILQPNEEIPLHMRGFPQGSALSPIMFNFAFEVGVLRSQIKKRNPNSITVSYADDFIVFSKDPIKGLDKPGRMMKDFGLEFNLEKSKSLREDGIWLTSKFKFLGVTFHVSNDKPIIVEGTPRSGASLVFDKEDMVQEFIYREIQLEKVAKGLRDVTQTSARGLINSWGEGTFPGNLIPTEVVAGKARVTSSMMSRIRNLAKGILSNPNQVVHLVASERALLEKLSNRNPLNWTGTRKAGAILNRLHTGSWAPLEETPSRSLESPAKVKGQSLLDLYREKGLRLAKSVSPHLRDKMLSIWNSTSLATVLKLDLLKSPKNVRIKGTTRTDRKGR